MSVETRTATWSLLGADIKGAANINEALEMSGLNYTVEKQPIQLENGYTIPGKFATVNRDNTEKVFGIVGSGYEICQNEEAFDFVNYLNEDISFVAAGQTRDTYGNMTWVVAQLPERVVLGDSFAPHVILQNSFNGSSPIKAAITPLRLVCRNQFKLVFANSKNYVNIRHSANMNNNIEIAKSVLKTEINYMDTFQQQAEKLATTKVTTWDEDRIIEKFYDLPLEASERRAVNVNEKRNELKTLYNETPDNQNFRNTAWGLINAYAEQSTHQQPARVSEGWREGKFMNVTFYSKEMMRLLSIINETV